MGFLFLFVTALPLKFTKPLNNAKIIEGTTETLTCEVSKDNVEVLWLKDGKPVKADAKHEVIVNGREHCLVVHDSTIDDEAQYTVQIVENQLTTTATLLVNGKCPRRVSGRLCRTRRSYIMYVKVRYCQGQIKGR